MRTNPVSKKASMPSMKTTLHEKLALIPATPESPATLDGSLHPSQAINDGRFPISNAERRKKSRRIRVLLFIFRQIARSYPNFPTGYTES